jgi:tetratricopeptide (TPR) repeat protein
MALSIDKANPAANIYFADKSEADGNSEAAVNVIYEVLKKYPDNLVALRKYFVLNKNLGFAEKGLNLMKESVEKNIDNPELLLLYVQALYSNKQYDQVTKVAALDILTAQSEGKVWDLLANAHIKLDQKDESVRALNHWRITQPNNRHAVIRSINLQDLLGNNQKALQLAKSADQKFENDTQFQLLVAYFYMRNGQLNEAKSTFNLLSEEVKDSSIGKGVLGQILLANDESQSAVPLLKEFYENESTNLNAMLVAKALKNADLVDSAFDFLKAHADDNEHTLLIDSQLAELSMLNENYAQAEKYYNAILLSAPENVRALNNLANVYILEHKYEEAVLLAKKAAELLPENAAILDTYSQAIKKTGRNKLALRIAQKAYTLNSDSPELSLNVAELLIVNDKHAQAKEIIDGISDNTPETVARIQLLRSKL